MSLLPDHEVTARQRQLAIVRSLSPTERLEQARRLARGMRELLASGFRQRHPDWSDAQVRRAVAERILYGRTG